MLRRKRNAVRMHNKISWIKMFLKMIGKKRIATSIFATKDSFWYWQRVLVQTNKFLICARILWLVVKSITLWKTLDTHNYSIWRKEFMCFQRVCFSLYQTMFGNLIPFTSPFELQHKHNTLIIDHDFFWIENIKDAWAIDRNSIQVEA